ncbi:MAG: hypothetical protein J6C97_00495, partial [Clostridia bacterium]|nr:hypothetical protein [Clostridia bacterium]
MKKVFNIKKILTYCSVILIAILSVIGINLTSNANKSVDAYRMPGNSDIARQIGQEGIFLLKNENN